MNNFLKGIVTGLGAVAPGLSGSVLLVIFGLYEKTIEALGTLFKDFKRNFKFLFTLVAGMCIGVLLFSKLVDFLLNTYEMPTRFAFLGFIIGSIPLFYKEVKKNGFEKKYYAVIALSAACGFILFNGSGNLFAEVTDPNILQRIVLGFAVAASYIVPGIDSAAILSALGLYELWVSAIADLDFSILIFAAIGLIVGVLTVSFIINKLIAKCYTLTFSVIFGFFLTVIPSVLNDSCKLAMNSESVLSVILAVLCFIMSLLFGKLEKIKSKSA